MASLMENLIEVLNNESQEYDQLLELSTKKTPVLVAGNLEELARITDEEQLVVSRITHLERKRQEVFADIANVINRDVKTLLLPDLIEIWHKDLRNSRSWLKCMIVCAPSSMR